jgi:CRP-like cAMP-binding protein
MIPPPSGYGKQVGVCAVELRDNALLARLPRAEFDRLAPLLEIVDAPVGQQVYEPRRPIAEVLFPLDAVYSMVATAGDRAVVEVGTIGYEGMVGLPLFLGAASSPNAVFCQVAGRAACLPAADLREFLSGDGDLHRLLHRFTQTTMVQMAQNVACNSTHDARRRTARWLLVTADRVRRPDFPLREEFLGQMLGVGLPEVRATMGPLVDEGVVRYDGVRLRIVDRPALEVISCSCYRVLRDEFDRALVEADPAEG